MIVRQSRLIALSLFAIFSLAPLCLVRPAEAGSLFFSEYAEGSGNQKVVEIYNPTNQAISLNSYAFPTVTNAPDTAGNYEDWNTFAPGAQIAAGGTYVITHTNPNQYSSGTTHNYEHVSDQTEQDLSNGDDGMALVKGTEANFEVLDWIGNWDGDPGKGWDVAGVAVATKDHTLVRKPTVVTGNTSWSSAAGTTAEDSEWLVFDKDSYINGNAEYLASAIVGDHTAAPDVIPEPTSVLLVLFGLSWISLLKLRLRQG
jgi:hypothetical protein